MTQVGHQKKHHTASGSAVERRDHSGLAMVDEGEHVAGSGAHEHAPDGMPPPAKAECLPPAEVCRRIWADDSYGRVVLHADGTIRWANEAAAQMIGRSAPDVIGCSMADFIDPADLALAIAAVAEIENEVSSAEEGVPLTLGLRQVDGLIVHVEVGASNFLDVPELGAISLRLRPYDSQRYLQEFLTALVAGAPLSTDLRLLVQSIDHLVQESASAIVHGWDGSVFTEAVTVGLPGVLTGTVSVSPEDLERLPWVRCQRSDELEWSGVDELPDALRVAAAESGFRTCWAKSIVVPQGGVVAIVIVWRRLASAPRVGHRLALARSSAAAALAFERRRSEDLLVRAATVDPLTGMPNRSQFFASLEESMVSPEPGQLGVLYLDLDGFKPVNDTHGHRIGDRLLAEVSSLLADNVRPGDMVARLGGDEFAVLCAHVTGEDELCAVADRLIQVIREPVVLDGIEVLIGVSIGVAVAKVHGHTHDEVLDAADAALYRAKREGRGRYRVAVPS